jgi:hypothetical protein
MSGFGGGNGQGGIFSDPLTLALVAGTAIAAPYAAPLLFEGGALAGSTMLGSAAAGAGIGGLANAAMGKDVTQGMMMGGLGGAAGAGFGVNAAGMGTTAANGMLAADASGLAAQGLSEAQINATLAQSYGMTPAAVTSSLAGGTSLGLSGTQAAMGLGGIGLLGAMNAEKKQYGVPSNSQVNWNGGNLSNFRYAPDRYSPDVVRPPNPPYQAQYVDRRNPPDIVTPMTPYQPVMMAAGGGLMQDKTDFASGGMYPMSQQDHTQFATSPQMPASMQTTMAGYDPQTNPLTGEPTAHMAGGGLASLGSYSDGGQMLKGPGDGMSDSIPAKIGRAQPARLADNEFVVPADVVSHLGNGSSDAGAKKLYAMMNNVRKARTGKKKQAPQINAAKYMPA